MKDYLVSINLEIQTEEDDVESVKECVIAYLMELIEDDSLEFEVEPSAAKQ